MKRIALVCLLGCVVVLAITARPAFAAGGRFTQILCVDPDTGQGVQGHQEIPDGISTHSALIAVGVSMIPTFRCGPTDADTGIHMQWTGSGTTTTDAQGVAGFAYAPRGGDTFAGGSLWMAVDTGPNADHQSTIVHAGSADDTIYTETASLVCAWCGTFGSFDTPLASGNEVRLKVTSDGFAVATGCDLPYNDGNWLCTVAGQRTTVYSGKVFVQDSNAPVATEPASGGLVTDAPLRGSESVHVAASDAGSGLYRVRLFSDGQAMSSKTIDSNGGACVDVNPGNQDAYEFASDLPCARTADATYLFDTTQIPEGTHHIVVQIEDAGGNAATVLDRTVEIHNAPPHSVALPQSAPPGPGVTKSATGTPASSPVVVHLSGRTVLHVPYGRRVTLTGRVVDPSGAPAAKASLSVLTAPLGLGAVAKADGRVTSASTGAFRYVLRTGPSRVIRIKGDGGTAAELTIHVRAGLHFGLSSTRLRNGQTLTYTGSLRGPYTSGRFVTVQVHNGRVWQVICALRTSSAGTFRCAHHFTRTFTATSYAFRAVVGTQARFPYDATHSKTLRVHVTP